MNYFFPDLDSLAQYLRSHAVDLDKMLDDDAKRSAERSRNSLSARDRDCKRAQLNTWLRAAEIVRDTVLQNMPVAEEYSIEMANAVEYCGVQIWASIRRHAGDPRWEYTTDHWALNGERRR